MQFFTFIAAALPLAATVYALPSGGDGQSNNGSSSGNGTWGPPNNGNGTCPPPPPHGNGTVCPPNNGNGTWCPPPPPNNGTGNGTSFVTKVTFDYNYNNKDFPITNTACGDFLKNKFGYTTLGNVPSFPGVGGAVNVTSNNSPFCGSCWKLTYQDQTSVYITAIDRTGVGFNINQQAFNQLDPNNNGVIEIPNVVATQVDTQFCNMHHP